MENKLLLTLLFTCLLTVQSHARVVSNSNSNVTQMAVEQQTRDIQDQLRRNMITNCQASGGQADSYGNCKNQSTLPSVPNANTPSNSIRDPQKSSTTASSEATLIAKHRSEVVQRCGLLEDASTKITSMKDSEKEFRTFNLNDPIANEPRWVVTYSIDTGNIVFGERQYERRTCWIVKKTGQGFWR